MDSVARKNTKFRPHVDGKKFCVKCEEYKSLDGFRKNKAMKDGLHSYCKPCHYKFKKANEARKRQDPEWLANDLAKKRAYFNAYYAQNSDARRAKNQEGCKRRRRENPEKYRAIGLQQAKDRYARTHGASGKYTLAEWKTLCDKYGNKCLACGRSDVKLTVDHVVPLTLGGSNFLENLQPLCLSCNGRKSDRHIDYRPKD